MSKKHKHNIGSEHRNEIHGAPTGQNLMQQQRTLAILLLLQALSEKIKENNKTKMKKAVEIPLEKTDTKDSKVFNIEDSEKEEDKENKEDNEIKTVNIVSKAEEKKDEKANIEKCKEIDLGGAKSKIVPKSKVTACRTTMLPLSQNESIKCNLFFKSGIIKVPVVISKLRMKLYVESLIKFPEQVFQVKSLDQNIILKKCNLILGTDKLFVKGIIEEQIEYANATSFNKNLISGNVKKSSFNIPFQGSTKVNFRIPPKIPKHSSKLELEVVNPKKNDVNIFEKSYGDFKYSSDNIFCNLCSTEIMETDSKEDIRPLKNTIERAHTFRCMRKKMIVNLDISLSQKQEIFISCKDKLIENNKN